MQKLVKGIHEFQSQFFRSHQEMFARLAKEQNPDVLFVTCSDSRVVPSLITQTDPGDLFIIRNAGNIIPAYGISVEGGEAATLEYALEALGVKDVIVCGHSGCGAMNGLLKPESLGAMPSVAGWLRNAATTARIVRDHYAHLEGRELLAAAVEENVLVQLEHLRTHPSVATRLARGTLTLHGWVYKLETGQVFAYEPAQHQYVPIESVQGTPTPPARLVPTRSI